jgi:hypothetical protein
VLLFVIPHIFMLANINMNIHQTYDGRERERERERNYTKQLSRNKQALKHNVSTIDIATRTSIRVRLRLFRARASIRAATLGARSRRQRADRCDAGPRTTGDVRRLARRRCARFGA